MPGFNRLTDGPSIQTWKDLSVECHKDGNFLVKLGPLNHRGFKSVEKLLDWLKILNLSITETPEPKSVKTFKIDGSFRTAMHSDVEKFNSTEAIGITRTLCYGEYTLAIISHDKDEIRTVHMLAPTAFGRIVFPYKESKELVG